MIVGVNARFLTKPYTGVGQYTRYLFLELARQHPDDTFVLVTPQKVDTDFPPNVEIAVVRERWLGTSGMKKTHWEQVKLSRFFRKRGVDVVHYPYPSNPWKGFEKPVVVTVHDTIPWVLPEYRRSFLTRLYQDRARKAVKKADRILTVSQASKSAIMTACGVGADKVEVIPNAPSPQFLKVYTQEERHAVLEQYGVRPDRRYFLYVGGYDERKNVKMVARTYLDAIACDHQIDFVFVGEKSLNDRLYASFDDTKKHRKEHSARHKGQILLTGPVQEADLPALYQAAYAFVNVSKMEGFNLPLIEAAVSGTPMIVSNIPVHHEVIGAHALYADIGDMKGLEHLMTRLITDDDFYRQQKKKIERYECPYSLEESARLLYDVYTRLVSG